MATRRSATGSLRGSPTPAVRFASGRALWSAQLQRTCAAARRGARHRGDGRRVALSRVTSRRAGDLVRAELRSQRDVRGAVRARRTPVVPPVGPAGPLSAGPSRSPLLDVLSDVRVTSSL